MWSNARVAKSDLISRAISEAHRAIDDLPDLSEFLQTYYRHVSDEGLVGRDPVDVFGAAVSQRRLAQERPPGTARVRVFNPTLEAHGWFSPHTVVEIVTDDMPFLVDSVTSCLAQEGLSLHLVVHRACTRRGTQDQSAVPRRAGLVVRHDWRWAVLPGRGLLGGHGSALC